VRISIACILCHLMLAGQVLAAERAEITGAVAYTDVVRFDYAKSGTKSRVQFWLEFRGRSAVGEPGQPGQQPEEGAISYYLYDVEKKTKVANWLMGFSMMSEPPPSGPYPMTKIVIEGNTAHFEAFNLRWTVVDGGEGYARDRVTVDDGFQPKEMRMYDGDLRVVVARTRRAPSDDACVSCHDVPAKTMTDRGGKHAVLGCADCHVGHPPEAAKPRVQCTQCHQPHAADMPEAACNACHRGHTASGVTYAFDVPSGYCAACHKEAAEVLGNSQSKHRSLGCALCHRAKHGTTLDCQHCHGSPHPAHLMTQINLCGACHSTAHDLDRARPK